MHVPSDWASFSAKPIQFHVPYLRVPPRAVVLAAVGHQQQQQQQQELPSNDSQQQLDVGLEAFKALIAEKRFTCTQCGKCCTGDGEVWIADEEAERIAAHLGMPLQRFHHQYVRAYSKVEGFKLLKAKNNPARDCIFLQPDNTCSIHKVRPLQCSTYPWWPDLMNDYDWNWEKENICEGFDHPDAAPTDTTDAARELRAATAMEYRRMLARKPSKKQKKQHAVAAAILQPPVPAISSSGSAGDQDSHSGSSSSGHSSQEGGFAHSTTNSQGQAGLKQPAVQQPHNLKHPGSSSQLPEHPQADGDAAPHASRKDVTKERWQQRLARLQELADVGDDLGRLQ